MAQQRPGIDLSKLSTADKLILGGAGGFFIWSFIPVWYSVDFGEGFVVGSASFNGWRSMTLFAALLSILALIWAGLRLANVSINVSFKPGMVDLGIAALALLFTLLGLVVKYAGVAGFSWGLFVGILLALVWSYGAYMKYQEPATVVPPPPPGGFTA
jgi:hypothetical protein